MAGFRISHPAIQWTDDDGNLVPDGSLEFYITGTSTPKAVYSDAAATVSIGTTLDINAAARAPDFFMSGEYRVILKDADGDQVWLRDNVRDVATGGVTALDPADSADGGFYRSNGVTAYWDESVRELPDPTGSDGYMVVADGDGYSLVPQPEEVTYDADNLPGGISATASASGSVVVGAVRIQWGTDTAPTAGALSTTKAVTFGTAFSSTPYHIGIEPVLGAGVTSNSPSGYPNSRYTSASTTGFTAGFFVGEENNGGTDTISSTIPFTWVAIGPA